MNLLDHFDSTRLSELELSPPVIVEPEASVRDVVQRMAADEQPCAFVVGADGGLLRVFTERDVARHVVQAPDVWDHPITEFVRRPPETIDASASAHTALRQMLDRGYRNLPVVSDDHATVNISQYDLLDVAVAGLPTGDLEGDELDPEHALRFVTFYGLASSVPVEFGPDASLYDVTESMIRRDRGLVTVVDDRGIVIGELTEHDVFTKIACRVTDLRDGRVGDYMTEAVAAVLPQDSVETGLRELASRRHRYLLVRNETGRALGVVTFGGIAAFLEATLTQP